MMSDETIRSLVSLWREDPGGTYRSWFLGEERIRNFRSIRRGLVQVVAEIEAGTFGNTYRGSSLEKTVHSIAEQQPIFRGADHAWLWKPKLRIPDIYENRDNQRAFGRFLNACVCGTCDRHLLDAVRELDRHDIKGVGPAAANLLYFLHPTLAPPFNTAMVRGYNALTGAKVKLGKWTQYLAMRDGILALNQRHRDLLSNDLGAVAALLFDVGSGRYLVPQLADDAAAGAAWKADLAKVRDESAKADRVMAIAREGDQTHTQVQGWLRDLGLALGFAVWIAANDQARVYAGGRLDDGCLDALPAPLSDARGADTIRLIDVLWLERDADGRATHVAGAFEVEHTTSIYSGIVRLLDLARGAGAGVTRGLFLVAPDDREAQVRDQLRRPAFNGIADLGVKYLSYGDLGVHREAMARFGHGLKSVDAIARSLG